ncbi:MAG: hypothetical protein IJA45_00470 [Oscillospiraceae bacterium]|nr:hypothetical protein [Oscillospiraceae bacterium]
MSSIKKYCWICSKCEKVWYASVKERIDEGVMCSKCRKQLDYCA